MRFSVLFYRELTQCFLDLQEVGGVDGQGMALDLLARVFQLCMLSDFSSSKHARRASQNKVVPKGFYKINAVDQD